jgi:hypothetical protein
LKNGTTAKQAVHRLPLNPPWILQSPTINPLHS